MTPANPQREYDLMMTRRQLFGRTALGLGTAAMANLLGSELSAEGKPEPSRPLGLQAQDAGDVWKAASEGGS